jgi:hypothetical protein
MSEQSMLFPVTIGRPAATPDEPTRSETRLVSMCIPMLAGRVMRCCVVSDAAGTPHTLILAAAYLVDDELRTVSEGVRVPVDSWPAVRRTVETLLAADGAT